jgi:hypothetical protein
LLLPVVEEDVKFFLLAAGNVQLVKSILLAVLRHVANLRNSSDAFLTLSKLARSSSRNSAMFSGYSTARSRMVCSALVRLRHAR